MAIGNVELSKTVFPNTRALEQQEWNKTKKQKKNIRREEWVWKEAILERKKRRPDGVKATAQAYPPQWKWMNYLTNLTYTYIHPLPPLGGGGIQ